jgi:hypothetical protein
MNLKGHVAMPHRPKPRKATKPGLFVALVMGYGNEASPCAYAMIDGVLTTICVGARGCVVCYGDAPRAGRPVLFRGRIAARNAAMCCRWVKQKFACKVARGHNRGLGIELVGADTATIWHFGNPPSVILKP